MNTGNSRPVMKHRSRFTRPRGFSLLEVLIAVVILSFGLLGMALLQSISLRSGQGANYRTQATMLSYQIMDMMRANRAELQNYNLIRYGNFAANCPAATGAAQWQVDRASWICSVQTALPNGQGNVEILPPSATPGCTEGCVRVQLRWADNRNDQSATTAAQQQNAAADFQVTTRL
ncbi:type IV pilus modification protein PilV [Arenimonas oryziterrae]|uniref:Type IV pilus modification protein PilV n=1 Tax=Arenimonas oryziterrae DSM 21050 = YC6267 TaxID=1121015 RepID=A0A091BKY2_9GAMM|nr:type IV pilus modification protein PilV [Arenimonas oryziterrae]KFN44965.1 hypothetical protein N789_02805 [Arenimonas oryziterrae DSM 21050 = YC6267]